jgi:hypothetical protein
MPDQMRFLLDLQKEGIMPVSGIYLAISGFDPCQFAYFQDLF